MTKWHKLLVVIITSVMLVVVCLAAYLYVEWWVPNQKLRDFQWCQYASHDEMRNVCHKVLGFRISGHHDAFIYLANIGNAKSVPILIRALGWYEPQGKDGFSFCARDHCLDALRSLTGHDAGNSFQDWSEWWEKTGAKLPPEEFHPRKEASSAESVGE